MVFYEISNDRIDDEHYDKAQRIANKIGENIAICLVDVGDSTEIKYYAEMDLYDPEVEEFIRHIYAVVDWHLTIA